MDFYTNSGVDPQKPHQITILDLSELASEVLENVTALLGRLVLEFMQRNPERGRFPVVLVLEEAHHYIPANARLERQQRAREVFEKIAKEGRKFGLSLVVASQRPSELSRTVLAQCNSFIVHRIQNPDDQEYFKSVISGINRELLDQLPALAQQQAIVLGDCVALPLQVRINTVEPRPRSDDPSFTREWSSASPYVPDIEEIAERWEGRSKA
jgi:DNA helicase HerA-like ATPase